MFYPVYVHKDKGSAFGVTIPDFPGAFSAADNWEDLPAKVQEAIELFCEGEVFDIPKPSAIDDLDGNDYQGGQWVFVDVNLDKLNPRVKRVNITLPEPLLLRLDRVVKEAGKTRSGFLSEAADEKLEREFPQANSG
jgi:predicted RNase H-like HicB family nuclease